MKCHNNSANLINPIPPGQYSAYMRWYYGSVIFLCGLMISLCLYSGYLYWQVSQLKKQHGVPAISHHNNTPSHHENTVFLQEQLDALCNKMEILHGMCQKKSIFNVFLAELLEIIPDALCLTHVEFAHNMCVELAGQSRSLPVLTAFLQALQKIPAVAPLQITQLQPIVDAQAGERMQFILR